MAEVPLKLSYLQISPDDWKNKKEIKQTKSGRIDQIIDPHTLLLKDGTVIRLASIDIPSNKQKNDIEALKYLKQLLPADTKIQLYQTRQAKSGRVNRMDHALAHLVTEKDNIWVQGSLLKNGYARIYTAPNHDELLPEMIITENVAINDSKNIWSEMSENKILTPKDAPKYLGDFVVINGTVQKVASIRNNIYLNFGKDWKTDFTIMITPTLRKKFAHQAIDLLSLANQPVRVRGWLREYNGPFIELEDIAHLQILDNPSNLPDDNPIID